MANIRSTKQLKEICERVYKSWVDGLKVVTRKEVKICEEINSKYIKLFVGDKFKMSIYLDNDCICFKSSDYIINKGVAFVYACEFNTRNYIECKIHKFDTLTDLKIERREIIENTHKKLVELTKDLF